MRACTPTVSLLRYPCWQAILRRTCLDSAVRAACEGQTTLSTSRGERNTLIQRCFVQRVAGGHFLGAHDRPSRTFDLQQVAHLLHQQAAVANFTMRLCLLQQRSCRCFARSDDTSTWAAYCQLAFAVCSCRCLQVVLPWCYRARYVAFNNSERLLLLCGCNGLVDRPRLHRTYCTPRNLFDHVYTCMPLLL